MLIRPVRLVAVLGLAVLPLAGCYVAPAPVYAPRPVYVRPPPPPVVYAPRPPPPVVYAPAPGY